MASGFTGPAATALQETETARQHFFLSSDISWISGINECNFRYGRGSGYVIVPGVGSFV
jgi:hypothetical protein